MKDDADLRRLDDLVAVVTGGAQGLGLGIAEQLSRDGADVTIGAAARKNLDFVPALLRNFLLAGLLRYQLFYLFETRVAFEVVRRLIHPLLDLLAFSLVIQGAEQVIPVFDA